jgi:hypothetical protein
MQTAANIIAFRELLRARFPEAHAAAHARHDFETGIACLDAAGIAPGCITEIASAHGSAGAGLILAALLEGGNDALQQPVALVDGADAFDPRDVPPEALGRLLWLRCRDAARAVRAADLLLRDGNIPRVLLDLQLCPAREVRQIPAQAWHRLRMLTEKGGAILCAFTSFQTVPCARSRLVLEQPQPLEALDAPRAVLLSSLKGRATRRGTALQSETLSATG